MTSATFALIQVDGHSLIRRDWPAWARLKNLLQEPQPLSVIHLAVNVADHRVIDHGVIVMTPLERLLGFNAVLRALRAEHGERNQVTVIGSGCGTYVASVGLMT